MRYCGRSGIRHCSEGTVKPGRSKTSVREGLSKRCIRMMKASMLANRRGMEMVQVAILIALAVALGIIFRTEITKFVNNTFSTLNS